MEITSADEPEFKGIGPSHRFSDLHPSPQGTAHIATVESIPIFVEAVHHLKISKLIAGRERRVSLRCALILRNFNKRLVGGTLRGILVEPLKRQPVAEVRI